MVAEKLTKFLPKLHIKETEALYLLSLCVNKYFHFAAASGFINLIGDIELTWSIAMI